MRRTKSPASNNGRIRRLVVVALALSLPALAMPEGWGEADWSKVSPSQVRALLGSGDPRGWESVGLSERNDPGRHLPPGRASALLLALCYSRDAEVVKALLDAGARAEGQGGDSPLMYAAQFNPEPGIIRLLLAAGASPTADLGYRMLARPALTYAAQYNAAPAVIAELIAAGAAVDAKVSVLDNMGLTPLMYAAQYNAEPAIVEALARAGANVERTDAMDRTALILAAQYNDNPEVLRRLLRLGARVNFRSRDYYNVDWTPLMYAAASASNPLPKIRLLLDAGADPSPRSKDGRTALDYAAMNPLVPKADLTYLELERRTR
jgi:ankyrin repeat protein